MKIAISGAHSTGKSTLIEELKKSPILTEKFTFLGNITRLVKKRGNQINENGTNESQILVLAQHLENYVPRNVILDRCALDGLVYTTYLFQEGKVSVEVLRIAEAIFENLRYDVIFYILPEFDIEDDGVRSTKKEFQTKIVDLFNEYIEAYNIPVVFVHGDVKKRVKDVTETILKYIEAEAEESKLVGIFHK